LDVFQKLLLRLRVVLKAKLFCNLQLTLEDT
jgi:hypothetical protein